MPLTVGFISKWYLVRAALEQGLWPVAVLVLVGSLLAAGLRLEGGRGGVLPAARSATATIREAPLSLLIPTWILVLANFYFGIDASLTAGVATRAAESSSEVGREPGRWCGLARGSSRWWAPALVLALGRSARTLARAATLVTGVALFASWPRCSEPVRAGARPRLDLVEVVPGVQPGARGRAPGAALRAGGVVPLDRHVALLDRLHAGPPRGEPDPLLLLLRHRDRVGALGVAFSANLFTLFVFYEALTLCTFPLVTHHGPRRRSGRGGSTSGILLTTSVALPAPGDHLDVAARRHAGLPAGRHPGRHGLDGRAERASSCSSSSASARRRSCRSTGGCRPPWSRPRPVSALLHAVAVVKAGVFTILKVAVYVFGLDLLGTLAATPWLAWVAAATIILGSLVAFTKDNLKARLAYSTISQLSYIVLGAMLANRWGIIGGGMHIAMHAFGKITLFFGAGAVLVAAHETEISRMHGLGRTMPITFGAFFIGVAEHHRASRPPAAPGASGSSASAPSRPGSSGSSPCSC